MKQHDWGNLDQNINIALITADMLKAKKIRASASEMFVLFTHFPFFIGDYVNPDFPEWDVYLLLRQILGIVLQKEIHKNTHQLLETLISEHHELFQKVFDEHLTPKFHFILHYPPTRRELV